MSVNTQSTTSITWKKKISTPSRIYLSLVQNSGKKFSRKFLLLMRKPFSQFSLRGNFPKKKSWKLWIPRVRKPNTRILTTTNSKTKSNKIWKTRKTREFLAESRVFFIQNQYTLWRELSRSIARRILLCRLGSYTTFSSQQNAIVGRVLCRDPSRSKVHMCVSTGFRIDRDRTRLLSAFNLIIFKISVYFPFHVWYNKL